MITKAEVEVFCPTNREKQLFVFSRISNLDWRPIVTSNLYVVGYCYSKASITRLKKDSLDLLFRTNVQNKYSLPATVRDHDF